jgi:hypothetical protein
MNSVPSRFVTTTIALLLLASAAQPQQDQQAKPLGDVAREQQQSRKHQKKATASRVYGDIEATPATSEPPGETAKVSEGERVAKEKSAAQTVMPQSAGKELQIKAARRSVFDQAKTNKPDFIIVPAGTEIRVDIVEGKVVVPVRVGFATPIPALSIAAVKVNPVYYNPVFYNVVAGTASNFPVAYGETAELTAVTVHGITYPVRANAIPLNSGGVMGSARSLMSSRDAVFVLSAAIPIER